MRRIKVNLSIGYCAANRTGVIEVEDDATEEEIWELTEEWAQQFIEMSWKDEEPRV